MSSFVHTGGYHTSNGSSNQPDIFNLPSEIIHRTTNYNLFKAHHLNRQVNPNNLNKIKKSMAKKSLLSTNPILVDRMGLIYDGNHRFTAAKELGLEVFFIISDNLGVNDIASLNTAAKPWSLQDFLDYHCKRGIQSYIDFRDVYNTLSNGNKKVGLTTSFTMACSVCSSRDKNNKGGISAFKEGRFTFDRKGHLYKVLTHAEQFQYLHSRWTSNAFIGAINQMVKTKGYNAERMINKAQQRANFFHPVSTAAAYLDMMEKMYNHGLSEKSHIRFRRR